MTVRARKKKREWLSLGYKYSDGKTPGLPSSCAKCVIRDWACREGSVNAIWPEWHCWCPLTWMIWFHIWFTPSNLGSCNSPWTRISCLCVQSESPRSLFPTNSRSVGGSGVFISHWLSASLDSRGLSLRCHVLQAVVFVRERSLHSHLGAPPSLSTLQCLNCHHVIIILLLSLT